MALQKSVLAAVVVATTSACAPEDGFWEEARDDAEAWASAVDGKSVALHPGKIDDAELVETLPVARNQSGAERRVAMRLGPSDIPSLKHGDRLITPAEVQVTTRCDVGQGGPGCGYNPHVAAQLILAADPKDTDPAGAQSKAISPVQELTCTKAEHHCMFAFSPSDANETLEGASDLPCVAKGSCHVNLVMWAWHPDARSGGQDKILVGENEGNYLANGVVKGDKGRLSVVRERGLDAADRATRETSGGGSLGVATNAESVLVYSHALKAGGAGLKAGEHFVVEAKLVAAVGGRARFSSKMFLTKNPKAADGDGLEKTFPRSIGEHNGINCTPGTSPCTLRKVAVFSVEEDIDGPVYVHVAARSAVPGGGSTKVEVRRNDGWLRSMRYDAALGAE